jgi:hypothetical protein
MTASSAAERGTTLRGSNDVVAARDVVDSLRGFEDVTFSSGRDDDDDDVGGGGFHTIGVNENSDLLSSLFSSFFVFTLVCCGFEFCSVFGFFV